MATLAFEKSFGKWMEAEKELFNESEAYIKSQLELMPNKEIYIDYENISSTPTARLLGLCSTKTRKISTLAFAKRSAWATPRATTATSSLNTISATSNR